jgi:hypothetical protein
MSNFKLENYYNKQEQNIFCSRSNIL